MFTFTEFVYIFCLVLLSLFTFSADDEEADVPTDEMEKLTSSTTTEGEDESFLGFAVFPSKTKVSTELARRMLQKNLERLLLNHTETCRDVISQLVSLKQPNFFYIGNTLNFIVCCVNYFGCCVNCFGRFY